MTIVMLTTDLLIASQASAAATAQGAVFSHVASAAALLQQVQQQAVDLIAIDLATCDADLAEWVPRLRNADAATVRIVAFGPHVHPARLAAARQAGCDEVFSRGQFHAGMHQLFAAEV
ncbi:MAG: DNA-binding response regulator [Planctomycetales bacterium]|nr:DNA-binding response regulator [Planctomycetales bacterium]NIM08793.1 DNA-binding response regulator [Planctomycetales bacterium]NIN08256.1 DNA-binding response regulator [Planctomycetales bacterium]NIN77381.1 DNA-binding response regulator [Planctomycetales bacterium]NIO34565.1 DNA-binding response regulator [Planctomycetales bacterium]